MKKEDDITTRLESRFNRRNALRALGGTVLATTGFALAGCGGSDSSNTPLNSSNTNNTNTNMDVSVLNFALNLEYLEAEFYSYATTGHGIPDNLFSGSGTPGATTGGSQVSLSGSVLQVAQEIANDELTHVVFLRSALGGAAVAKPAINLNALGIGFASEQEFLILARAFEDVGVSAYSGAARLITNKDYLEAAARILATEAYHAGNVRYQLALMGGNAPAVDGLDQPPSSGNFFPTDSNGLAVSRSAAQVAAIVRGANEAGGAFYPQGLNGAIK